jgi:hypothetical protein
MLADRTKAVSPFGHYISAALEWERGWNEIIITMRGTNNVNQGWFIMYFNGKKEVLRLYKKVSYRYSNPVIHNKVFFGGFTGCYAGVMIIPSILNVKDTTRKYCKYWFS